MKKYLQFSLIIITFLSLNFSAKSYTRNDLENFQTDAAIVEAVLSLPFILNDEPSTELFLLPLPAMFTESCTSRALESNSSYISSIKDLILVLKLCANPEFSKKIGIPYPQSLVLRNILIKILYAAFMKSYPEQKHRVKRRFFRATMISLIDATLFSNKSLSNKEALLINFCGNLLLNGIKEYIAEEMIQGIDDNCLEQ